MDLLLKTFLFFLSLFSSISGERVPCRQVTKPDGRIVFDCQGAVPASDLIIRNKYILWLEANNEAPEKSIDIRIPNYKIDVAKTEDKNAKGNAKTIVKVQRPKEDFTVVLRNTEPCEKFKNCTTLASGIFQDIDASLSKTKRVTITEASDILENNAVDMSDDANTETETSTESPPAEIHSQLDNVLDPRQQANQLSYNAKFVDENSGQSSVAPALILTVLISYCIVL